MCIFILSNLDSPYRDKISSIILKLQEDQTIQKFYNTWWKEKNKDGECIDSTKKQTNALTIKNVGGIFVVLIAGTMAGVVVAFFEFLWKARKNAKEDKVGILSTCPLLIEFLVIMLYIFWIQLESYYRTHFEFKFKSRKGHILKLKTSAKLSRALTYENNSRIN